MDLIGTDAGREVRLQYAVHPDFVAGSGSSLRVVFDGILRSFRPVTEDVADEHVVLVRDAVEDQALLACSRRSGSGDVVAATMAARTAPQLDAVEAAVIR